MESIIRQAKELNQPQDGDYKQEGLLYCGQCHTPRECRMKWQGKQTILPIPCKCRHLAAVQRDLEETRRAEEQRLRDLRASGFPDNELAACTFDKDDRTNVRLSSIAHKYVENFAQMKTQHMGLLLHGGVGCGKSFMAACIVNSLIDRHIPCMMTNFSRIVNRIQEKFDGRQQYIDSLNRFQLLVIDDMAVERDTEYMWEMIMTIIDSRYRSGLPLIVTTNLTARELADPSDIRRKRVYSRLMEMCLPIEVSGEDRRKTKARQNINNAKNLLGL